MRSYGKTILRDLPALGWDIREATGRLREPAYAVLFGLTGSAALFIGLDALAAGDRPRAWFLAVAAIAFAAAVVPNGQRSWSRRFGVAAGLSGGVVWAYLLGTFATHDPISIAILGLLAIACLRSAIVLANTPLPGSQGTRALSDSWIEELPDDAQAPTAPATDRSPPVP
jgi:hypothetical protein